MSASPLSPVPLMPANWIYNYQRDYLAVRGEQLDTTIIERTDALARGIEDVCHRYGVTITRATVYQRGVHITLYLDVAAGEWRGKWHAYVADTGHGNRQLCSKFLRWLRSLNEELC